MLYNVTMSTTCATRFFLRSLPSESTVIQWMTRTMELQKE
uniref:Uncharacterized protein n=2 Tax=Anguilla anguilla TaxID=7936 RepID=A0A0E9TZ02_ANGAN